LLTAAVVANGEHTGQYIERIAFEQLDFLNIMAYDENDANHSSIDYAKASIDYWHERGVPREKIILGVPFYARPSWASYSRYVEADAENACRDQADNNYYNGMATIRSKAAYSNSISCGVMIWELSQDTRDDTSLLRTIWAVVNHQPQTPACQ
jgi:GH18 family chitinase